MTNLNITCASDYVKEATMSKNEKFHWCVI